MRARVKIGLVLAGYVGAFVVAGAIVAIHVATTSGLDRQSAGGMFAFGDSLLFLAAFGAAGIPATAAALFFLRPYRAFWRVLSVAALVIVATGLAAFGAYRAAHAGGAGPLVRYWSSVAVLRILVTPLLAGAFLLAGVFAPNRFARIALVVAALVEAAIFAWVAFTWLRPLRP